MKVVCVFFFWGGGGGRGEGDAGNFGSHFVFPGMRNAVLCAAIAVIELVPLVKRGVAFLNKLTCYMALRSIIAQRDGNFCDEKCRYKWRCPCSWKNQLEVGESQFSGQRETLTMRSLLAGFTKSCGTRQSALPCRIIIN